jgi:hypothetical protein
MKSYLLLKHAVHIFTTVFKGLNTPDSLIGYFTCFAVFYLILGGSVLTHTFCVVIKIQCNNPTLIIFVYRL